MDYNFVGDLNSAKMPTNSEFDSPFGKIAMLRSADTQLTAK
jgi:hypothetical protein